MRGEFKELRLRQMDELFAAWRPMLVADRPPTGWVRAVREALGMTAEQLGRRLGMTRQGAVDLERREREGGVTLTALQAAADAMGATVVYAIVPKTSLAEIRRVQAHRRAAEELASVSHTMRLESQDVSSEETARQRASREEELLASRRLWGEG